MKRLETIDQNDVYQLWLNTFTNKSENTRKKYISELRYFCEWLEGTPQEFYDKALELRNDPNPLALKSLTNLVINYVNERVNGEWGIKKDGEGNYKKIRMSSARQIPKVVKSFLKSGGIVLDFSDYSLHAQSEGSDAPTKEQLRTLLEFAPNQRFKAVVATLKDSGLRIGDLLNLKIKDIKPILDNPDLEFYVMPKVEQEKLYRRFGLIAEPILGIEAIKYIKLWMIERENLEISSTDQDYLFVNLQTQNGKMIGDRKVSAYARGDKISNFTVASAFKRVVVKAGLQDHKLTVHSLRKYFLTRLEVSGMPKNWILRLMGKASSDTSGVYSKPKSELLEKYKESYHELAIDDTQTQKKIERLEAKNIELSETVNLITSALNNIKGSLTFNGTTEQHKKFIEAVEKLSKTK